MSIRQGFILTVAAMYTIILADMAYTWCFTTNPASLGGWIPFIMVAGAVPFGASAIYLFISTPKI